MLSRALNSTGRSGGGSCLSTFLQLGGILAGISGIMYCIHIGSVPTKFSYIPSIVTDVSNYRREGVRNGNKLNTEVTYVVSFNNRNGLKINTEWSLKHRDYYVNLIDKESCLVYGDSFISKNEFIEVKGGYCPEMP